MNEKILTDADTERFIANMGAKLARIAGEASVYVAKQVNLTVTVFPGPKAGTRRVRVVRGCVC